MTSTNWLTYGFISNRWNQEGSSFMSELNG